MPKGCPECYRNDGSVDKEKLIKKLKRKKGVDNPFALANSIIKKGGRRRKRRGNAKPSGY